MTVHKIILLSLLFLSVSISGLFAYEEYAEQTGQACAVCHLDPAGGGELTAEGNGFALSLGQEAVAPEKQSLAAKLFRLLVGYLHILFAFFWFGTILYVHLILKPAYASRGLPKGEVKLGLLSIVMMGLTGAILFAYRVPDTAILFETRFGLLLLAKIVLYLIMVCSALFVVLFLGPRMRKKMKAAASDPVGEEMTAAELARFDGKEGRRAYFAYRGEIYDATGSPLWKEGSHMGRHQAGTDLTEAIGQAPHGEEKVVIMPKIARLKKQESAGLTPPQKIFYTMAYMNLGFVLLIILILACWKWW